MESQSDLSVGTLIAWLGMLIVLFMMVMIATKNFDFARRLLGR